MAHRIEQSLQIARCSKKIDNNTYMINIKNFGKYVVENDKTINPDSIEDGVRVGVEKNKYKIHMVFPTKIDASITLMRVDDKPDVTYNDIGGCQEQLLQLREMLELPLLYPEKFTKLGIDPPKGVLLYGNPGTGKTLIAKAIANKTTSTFIRVIGSELVQKYIGEGARLVRELFILAKQKKSAIIFFDEIDAIGGSRDGNDTDNEVSRTMLQIISELDGFDPRGNIKVIMATNRPDTLDPALIRPGRIDRKIYFSLPNLDGRKKIFQIHSRKMSIADNIR